MPGGVPVGGMDGTSDEVFTFEAEGEEEESGPTLDDGARSWSVLAAVLLAQFCVVAAIGTVTIAIPAIRADLGATAGELQWILLLFQFGFALLLITGGRLGDLYGTRRIFLIGFGGFVLGNVIAAAAPNPEVLLAARLWQGLCGGLAAPQVLAIIQTVFPGPQRIRAIGAFAAIGGSGYMLGQLITGGLLGVDLFGLGWRAAFLVYVPIGIVAFIIAAVLLPPLRVSRGEKLDIVGVGLVSVGGILILYPLIQGPEAGWPPWFLALVAVALVVLFLFVRHQSMLRLRDPAKPLMNLGLFQVRSFRWGLLIVGSLSMLALAQLVYITIGLQTAFALDPITTAFATAPMPIMFMVGASLAPRASRHLGRRVVALAAMLLILGTLAFIGVLIMGPQPPLLIPLVLPLLVLGLAYGLAQTPMMTFALSEVRARDAGSSSGTLQTVQQLSNAMGIALFGTVFFALPGGGEVVRLDGPALPVTMLMVVAVAIALLILHFWLPRWLEAPPDQDRVP